MAEEAFTRNVFVFPGVEMSVNRCSSVDLDANHRKRSLVNIFVAQRMQRECTRVEVHRVQIFLSRVEQT